jgi:hypothetical protein
MTYVESFTHGPREFGDMSLEPRVATLAGVGHLPQSWNRSAQLAEGTGEPHLRGA